MLTLYRIIDEDTLEVLVEDIPREQIWEYSEQFMDSGHTRLRSEQYQTVSYTHLTLPTKRIV